MRLYLATVDEVFTYQRPGCNESQWESRRRHLLVEAENIRAAWTAAAKTAEANAKFGPRPLGIEVRKVGLVTLPAAIDFESRASGDLTIQPKEKT